MFQLPALLKSGLTLVVSPLLALIEDQVADLKKRGLPAERLHSALHRRERQQILANLAAYRLVYLSPETLLTSTGLGAVVGAGSGGQRVDV
ncbi:MAG: hypothetical protein HC918_09660, partial [Oscillatoriales cyanobacterium SM2_1_8]|nr:hypothetical protein [Oscillatoriales cyanobacterium SM2_1_8]